jgi:hypothetical protein
MEIQMAPDELTRIAKFITDLDQFVNDNIDIVDLAEINMVFPFFDSNGDKLGEIRIADWGNFGFFPLDAS